MANAEIPEDLPLIRRQVGSGSLDQSVDRDTSRHLRTRLILIDSLLVGAIVLLFALAGLGILADLGLGSLRTVYLCLMAITFVPPLIVLVTHEDVPLRQLRRWEVVIFCGAGLILALGEQTWYTQGWTSDLAASNRKKLMELLGDSHSFPWFVLITFYAAFIPASGRRCAAVVGSLALMAILELFLLAWDDPTAAPDILTSMLGKTIFWMAIAVAVAVYGAQRLTQLRREAIEARKLGQYQIKKRLGGGGMGEVYLGEHQLLRRSCAIKLIRFDRVDDPTALVRFQREVKAMASLTHANAVEIFDYGQTPDGIFYYVMEHLTGLNLQELVERHGALPPERAVHILQQVCWPLREAHLKGLIHRDIKPGNIFVGERGCIFDVVKLLDFGLVQHGTASAAPVGADDDPEATWAGPLTQAGRVTGTPIFMSPEQITGAALDGRTDIYSLGVVAYFLMTGVVPFKRTTFKEVVAAHVREPVTPLADVCSAVDGDLNGIVMRCLEKDPANRFPDAETLAHALANCSCAGCWSPIQSEAWWRLHEPHVV